ncbi:hypothetical protein PybrP1_007260 [[Pythium] brassicae (nom. inval.)]|nr:hypothetical protein PybrP1_007260 [[Pythium] brassicae (nom. inval.)]
MSFFGFGKSKAPEPESESASYGAYEEPTYDYSSAPPSSFNNSSSSAALGGGGGGSFGASDVQNLLVEEQQRALIQQAISKITAIAWDKCSAGKPDTELSSKETDCIKNVTLAYIDSSAFIVHRLNKST